MKHCFSQISYYRLLFFFTRVCMSMKLLSTHFWKNASSLTFVKSTQETITWVLVNTVTYLNPTMGYSLQILHFAWCLAVSAAARRCSTGSHTRDCGSSFSHSRKWLTWISGRPLAYKYIIYMIINVYYNTYTIVHISK